MSMDVIRSLAKSNFDALLSLEKSIRLSLEVGKEIEELKETCQKVDKSLIQILQFVKHSMELLPIAARDIAYSIARTYIGKLYFLMYNLFWENCIYAHCAICFKCDS